MEKELTLRPLKLNEFIGQEKVVNNLKIFIEASIKRHEILDHVLIYGQSGLGKTTLANIIANELNTSFKQISGPSIEKPGDLASILSCLNKGDVLFIDEIHSMDKKAQEILYSAIEDYQINIIIGKDEEARNITIDLPPFVLIGATTKISNLTVPFRNRFGITLRLEEYDNKSLSKIIKRNSKLYNLCINEECCDKIASVSRFTPRVANNILKRIRDFIQFDKKNEVNIEQINKYLSKMEIDSKGLTLLDRQYINTIRCKFNGGPVGLESISKFLGEEVSTIENYIEPYLLKIGLIERTCKGRIIRKNDYFY